MLFGSMQEDDYVIKVDEAIYQVQLPEAILHLPLQCGRSIAKPKRHAFTLKKP